jgi:hypothetical protein
MAATTVLTTSQWNALLDKVNNATQNCGGGGLQHVTDPHLWSLSDITAVQNALKAGCSTATFTTPAGPPYLWQQKIIDEINAALSVACCNGGGSGSSGGSSGGGASNVVWYTYYCECYGSILACPQSNCCNECIPYNLPGSTGGGKWLVLPGSRKEWPVRNFPNAEALARANAAFWNASAYCNLGDENGYCTGQTVTFSPTKVSSYTVPGNPLADLSPCVCS